MLALHIKAVKLPPPEREYRFHPTRRWRLDFAWPDRKIAVEVEGVVHDGKGRHQTAKGYAADCEKYNSALLDGWKVLRFTPNVIKSGSAVAWIERAFSED